MTYRNLKIRIANAIILSGVLFSLPAYSQNSLSAANQAMVEGAKVKPSAEDEKKASDWVQSLSLQDPAKEAHLTSLIADHLEVIRNWHNSHIYTTVPAGINPRTGVRLNKIARQVIADSAIPDSVHQDFMNGLRANLDSAQVDEILDKYTVGKVAFTMKGYKAIVPDLTQEEQSAILNYLKQAREQAIDYKNMKEISAIFKIYKIKCQDYLNDNGRNWRKLYKAYYDKVQAEKKAKRKE